MDDDCIFCKIVRGETTCNKMYENEKILAFEDNNKQAPVHFLIIPKDHIKSFKELENFDIISEIFKALKILSKNLSDLRIVNNCGAGAGQTVNHMHFHIMGGRKFGWPPG